VRRKDDVVTYSIVARDAESGALGVAVQTCMFAVGAVVPWARAGVGAVASQAMGEPAYGPRCLDAIESGASAAESLARAQAADPAALLRQVGVVAADGTVAAATGEWCIDHAGHAVGDGFAVQANMMASDRVWPAMADAFVSSNRPFPRRLLAALDAAEAAGGDARGVMSAALLVVDGARTDVWGGRLVDLRVDRSDDPLRALHELLDASDAYAAFGRAVDALTGGDATASLSNVDDGLAQLPEEENLLFLRAGALAAQGDVDNARATMLVLLERRPTWEIVVRSFAAKGLLNLPAAADIDALLARDDT
jgi:uncharacterized Ntn-hydrolase superfamily protein